MITVEQALALVLQHALPLPPREVPLGEALGLVLARDVANDIDSPPYDKALVDGYAVCTAAFDGSRPLEIVEEIFAGDVPAQPVGRGTCTRLMTGAPLPQGADAVLMLEQVRVAPGAGRLGAIVIERGAPPQPGQNLLRRGAAMKAGHIVLRRGLSLRPVDIGLLAEAGCAAPPVFPRPELAILGTGNELVAVNQRPGLGQIRNSNGPMLRALAQSADAIPKDLGTARDDRDGLRGAIAAGLAYDVLVISGGVSAGAADLVPGVLHELGVEQVFHKLRLKPGKPLWFGIQRSAERSCLVFGLPGNPVSSLVCFELFVRPACRRLMSRPAELSRCTARLAGPFKHQGDRPTYHPAVLEQRDNQRCARIVPWQGSADLVALSAANALVHFPSGERQYEGGDEVEVLGL
jgi:molybdopterin molybdotransferase